MDKKVERYTCKGTIGRTDKDLREDHPEKITVFYVRDTYDSSVDHIMKLANAIREDFPGVSDKDMSVMFVARERSDAHGGRTILYIPIDIDDFIRLRNNFTIGVL